LSTGSPAIMVLDTGVVGAAIQVTPPSSEYSQLKKRAPFPMTRRATLACSFAVPGPAEHDPVGDVVPVALACLLDESDLLLALHGDTNAFQRPVKSIMSQKLTTVQVTASVESILPIFERGLVVIVCDGPRFLGLITRIDVLNYLRRKLS